MIFFHCRYRVQPAAVQRQLGQRPVSISRERHRSTWQEFRRLVSGQDRPTGDMERAEGSSGAVHSPQGAGHVHWKVVDLRRYEDRGFRELLMQLDDAPRGEEIFVVKG